MRVLNVPVSPRRLALWATWLAPSRQPFFLTPIEAQDLELRSVSRAEAVFSPELRDTFALWNVAPEASRVVWLDEAGWAALPQSTRHVLLRAQVRRGRGAVPRRRDFADLLPPLEEARFVWWSSLVSARRAGAGGLGGPPGLPAGGGAGSGVEGGRAPPAQRP